MVLASLHQSDPAAAQREIDTHVTLQAAQGAARVTRQPDASSAAAVEEESVPETFALNCGHHICQHCWEGNIRCVLTSSFAHFIIYSLRLLISSFIHFVCSLHTAVRREAIDSRGFDIVYKNCLVAGCICLIPDQLVHQMCPDLIERYKQLQLARFVNPVVFVPVPGPGRSVRQRCPNADILKCNVIVEYPKRDKGRFISCDCGSVSNFLPYILEPCLDVSLLAVVLGVQSVPLPHQLLAAEAMAGKCRDVE